MTGTMDQLKAVLEDESFVREISKMENNEEVQQAFKARGIEFSLEEIDQIAEKLYGDATELEDENLENVSGGFVITATMVGAVACVAAGVGLFAGIMTEVNNNRKAAGKKPIW